MKAFFAILLIAIALCSKNCLLNFVSYFLDLEKREIYAIVLGDFFTFVVDHFKYFCGIANTFISCVCYWLVEIFGL